LQEQDGLDMRVHTPLTHVIPRSSHPASTRGHTLGAPRAYDAFVNLFFLGRRRATFQALAVAAGVKPGQRVLDVGCGTGYFARLIAESIGVSGVVVGVDASQEMVAYASQRAGRTRNCQFQLGTAESLSLPSEHFDVVVSSLFMHHLPVDLRGTAVAEMYRVLRPGGTLLIAEARVPRAPGLRLLARMHGYDRMAQAVPDLERVIADAGFENVNTFEAPPWLRYVRATKTGNVRSE
jgi:ubiquinone/menaquinone biosynthesis C-methylase UbiE